MHEEIRPSIVWFLGSTGRTLVALGGRAQHLTHLYPHELKDKSPSDARLLHVEKEVVAQIARAVEPEVESDAGVSTRGSWVDDVLVLANYWQSELVEDVNFLAVEEHCTQASVGPRILRPPCCLAHPYSFSRRANERLPGSPFSVVALVEPGGPAE